MQRVRFLTLVTFAVSLMALWLVPQAAHAQAHADHSFVPQCHLASGTDVTLSQLAGAGSLDGSGPTQWICDGTDWRANEPVAWLRFDRSAWEELAATKTLEPRNSSASDQSDFPHYFFSRIARFESITFAAVDVDGKMRTARYAEVEGQPFAAGPVFQLKLPQITAKTEALIVQINNPHSVPLLTEARLSEFSEDAGWSQFEMMLLALVIGMLILPLFFDISFFIVLRERFVAVHAVMVASMIAYVLFAGGLISVAVILPLQVIAIAGPLFWAIGCGISALFLADFLEDGTQSEFMHNVTLGTGLWTICVPGFFAFQFHWTQPVDDRAYFVTFIPAIVVITASIAEGVWRGSRSARFIAVAWTPIMLASLERMARGLGWYVGPSNLDQMLYIATGIEVVVISLAIADRFLALRRERDAARTEARMLEKLSERDPLTGLTNRRALETRFDELREEGFDTFAVIDLDKFKLVNDRFGHQTGDKALIAAASALRGTTDRDTIAARLGGEEFIVMLRGKRSVERAEALRQSIPVRIASEVEGLDRPITASMGVIALPRSMDSWMSFDELYARADKLLYDAKAAGRNRTSFERVTVFHEAPLSRTDPKLASEAGA